MAGSPFANALGGGVQVGSALNDLYNRGRERRQLSALQDLVRDGRYQDAGASLIGLGRVGEGVDLMQVPLKQRIAEHRMQGGGVSYGKSPVYVRRPDGSLGIGVLGDDGNFKPIEGVNPAENLMKIGTGTGTVLFGGRSGQQVGDEIEEDVATPAYQETAAREQAKLATEAQAEFADLDTKMAGLREVVGQLHALSDAATYTKAGQAYNEARKQFGLEPTEGGIARTEYMATVDNQVLPLLKQTFGAAFTVQEGESLRATLGDPNKSPAEKKAVLNAFIAQKERDLRAMYAKLEGPQRNAAENRKPINVPTPQNAGKSRDAAIPIANEAAADSLPPGTWINLNGRIGRVK